MRLLLDTHAVMWWFFDPDALGSAAAEALGDDSNNIWVSVGSMWEIAIKHQLGKLPQAEALLADPTMIAAQGFRELPITTAHVLRAAALVRHHNDPFDRLLVAQAFTQDLVLVSRDAALDRYGVRRLWR